MAARGSRLDEILHRFGKDYEAGLLFLPEEHVERCAEAIKDLFLEIVGEDTQTSYYWDKPSLLNARNALRAELRKKIEEL